MKIRRIFHFQPQINFHSPNEQFELYFARFKQSDLGKIHKAIAWDALVTEFGLKQSKKGSATILVLKERLP